MSAPFIRPVPSRVIDVNTRGMDTVTVTLTEGCYADVRVENDPDGGPVVHAIKINDGWVAAEDVLDDSTIKRIGEELKDRAAIALATGSGT